MSNGIMGCKHGYKGAIIQAIDIQGVGWVWFCLDCYNKYNGFISPELWERVITELKHDLEEEI